MSKLGILTRTLTPETTVSCFLSAGEPCRALSFPPRGSLHRPPLSSPYPEEPGSLHQPRLQVPLCPDVPQVCPPQHQDVAPYSQPLPLCPPFLLRCLRTCTGERDSQEAVFSLCWYTMDTWSSREPWDQNLLSFQELPNNIVSPSGLGSACPHSSLVCSFVGKIPCISGTCFSSVGPSTVSSYEVSFTPLSLMRIRYQNPYLGVTRTPIWESPELSAAQHS